MKVNINSPRNYWLIFIFILALGLVSLFVFQLVLADYRPAKKNCVSPEIEMFRTQLALIPNSDSARRETVEGKIEAWETMIAICENGTPAPRIPLILPDATEMPSPPFVSGIFDGQPGAFFHAFEAHIENHWKGFVNGNRVIVFAGVWTDDPGQGFIAVYTDPSKGKATWSYHPSATKSGALRIVDAQGSRLVIQQAADKNLLYFDLPTLTYVNSLDAIVVPGIPTENRSTEEPTTIPYPGP